MSPTPIQLGLTGFQREDHVEDLNGDGYPDAYAVASFWTDGDARDAIVAIYFAGMGGGMCAF